MDLQQLPNAPTIEDLPDDVLALVIQRLEWRDRVRVEEVSPRWRRVALAGAWTKVRDLRELGGWLEPAQRRGLLSRAGLYLTLLDLTERTSVDTDVLREELELCPNLRHLAVWWHQLDETTLGLISAYGINLKSLKIRELIFPPNRPSPEILAATSEAIHQCSSLEYLVLEGEIGVMLNADLRLYASSLANLRHLALVFDGVYKEKEEEVALSAENIEALCSLPSLRSLTVWQHDASVDLAFLRRLRFSHLECLEIWADNRRVEHLIEALPHLGQSLRALRVFTIRDRTTPINLMERLFSTISNHLRRLEFLCTRLCGNWVDSSGAYISEEEATRRFYPALASPLLGGLRALALDPSPPSCILPWVETLGHLEYLGTSEALSTPQLCGLVKNCKNLRRLEFDHRYAPSIRDRVALARAVAEKKKPVHGNAPIPTLCVQVKSGYGNIYPPNVAGMGLRFVRENGYSSVIFNDYRFESLSERPRFR